MGLLDPATSDGRVIFFLPWQKMTIAGTTDTPTDITHHPIPSEEDINFILNEVRNYLSHDVEGKVSIPLSLSSLFYKCLPNHSSSPGDCHVCSLTHLHTCLLQFLLLPENLWEPNYNTVGRGCLSFPSIFCIHMNSHSPFLVIFSGTIGVLHMNSKHTCSLRTVWNICTAI